jgi:hypothetical protein
MEENLKWQSSGRVHWNEAGMRALLLKSPTVFCRLVSRYGKEVETSKKIGVVEYVECGIFTVLFWLFAGGDRKDAHKSSV